MAALSYTHEETFSAPVYPDDGMMAGVGAYRYANLQRKD